MVRIFRHAGDDWWLRGAPFALYLMLCTFGIFTFAYIAQLRYLHRRFEPAVVWLTPIALLVYLVMGTGLALDNRHIGMSEELLHRPFVWAWFLLAMWVPATACLQAFGNSLPQSGKVKLALALLVATTLCIPAYFGQGIQTMPSWGRGYQVVPACKVLVAQFVKSHSAPQELIQDSANDADFSLSALSERQSFVIDSGGYRLPDDLPERLDSVKATMQWTDGNQVQLFMTQHRIQWYVVTPEAGVRWGTALERRLSFACKGYQVYKF
jgi:hypothetical protein